MSDDIKQKKEELLTKLLKENPQLSMKEANVSIREAFDTGVAPPVFSRIKKSLFSGEGAETPKPKEDKKAKAPKKTRAKKAAEPREENKTEAAEMDLFDGSEAQKAKEEEASKAEQELKPEPLLSEDSAPIKKKRPKKAAKNEDRDLDAKAKSASLEENDSKTEPDQKDSTGKPDRENGEKAKRDQAPQPKEPDFPAIDPNTPKHPVKLVVHAPKADQVNLAGSFNQWKIDEYSLEKGDHGLWHFSGDLPEGEYEYKYVVDQKTWFLDMNATRVTDKTGVSHKITIPQQAS
jgi:hypothetical protein